MARPPYIFAAVTFEGRFGMHGARLRVLNYKVLRRQLARQEPATALCPTEWACMPGTCWQWTSSGSGLMGTEQADRTAKRPRCAASACLHTPDCVFTEHPQVADMRYRFQEPFTPRNTTQTPWPPFTPCNALASQAWRRR